MSILPSLPVSIMLFLPLSPFFLNHSLKVTSKGLTNCKDARQTWLITQIHKSNNNNLLSAPGCFCQSNKNDTWLSIHFAVIPQRFYISNMHLVPGYLHLRHISCFCVTGFQILHICTKAHYEFRGLNKGLNWIKKAVWPVQTQSLEMFSPAASILVTLFCDSSWSLACIQPLR